MSVDISRVLSVGLALVTAGERRVTDCNSKFRAFLPHVHIGASVPKEVWVHVENGTPWSSQKHGGSSNVHGISGNEQATTRLVLFFTTSHISPSCLLLEARDASREAAAETWVQHFLETTFDGFFDWHIKEDVLHMSPRFWEMLGYEPEEKEHRHSAWVNTMHPEDGKNALEALAKHSASRGAQPYRQEVRHRHKDGSTVHMLCQGRVVEWDEEGNAVRMLGTHTDVTAWCKKTEEARQAIQAQRAAERSLQLRVALVNYLFHGVRNAMHVLSTGLEVLRDHFSTQPASAEVVEHRETVQLMKDAIARGTRILDDTLDASMLEAGACELACQSGVNLAGVAHDAVKKFQSRAAQAGVALRLDNSEEDARDPRFCCLADKHRLDQVMGNLLANSLKFTPPGGSVRVSVYVDQAAVMASVVDTGRGIPADHKAAVFEPHATKPCFSTQGVKGVGLGLFISKCIMEAHRGWLEIMHSSNKGTHIRMALPLHAAAPAGPFDRSFWPALAPPTPPQRVQAAPPSPPQCPWAAGPSLPAPRPGDAAPPAGPRPCRIESATAAPFPGGAAPSCPPPWPREPATSAPRPGSATPSPQSPIPCARDTGPSRPAPRPGDAAPPAPHSLRNSAPSAPCQGNAAPPAPHSLRDSATSAPCQGNLAPPASTPRPEDGVPSPPAAACPTARAAQSASSAASLCAGDALHEQPSGALGSVGGQERPTATQASESTAVATPQWRDMGSDAGRSGEPCALAVAYSWDEWESVSVDTRMRDGGDVQVSGSDDTIASTKFKHILIVDDDPVNCRMLTRLLTRMHFLVDCLSDGSEFLDLLRRGGAGKYDLVLMDEHMPRVNGSAAVARARREFRWGGCVAMLSGCATQEDRALFERAGADWVLEKPFRVARFRECLRNMVQPLSKCRSA